MYSIGIDMFDLNVQIFVGGLLTHRCFYKRHKLPRWSRSSVIDSSRVREAMGSRIEFKTW